MSSPRFTPCRASGSIEATSLISHRCICGVWQVWATHATPSALTFCLAHFAHWKSTAAEIRRWLRSNPQLKPDSPLLPTRENSAMTRANVAQRMQLAVQQAALRCPELPRLTISPHTIRHTTAMHLLQAGVDITVIAPWLGHEHSSTSHMYVEADLAMKERALSRLTEPGPNALRYRPQIRSCAFYRRCR